MAINKPDSATTTDMTNTVEEFSSTDEDTSISSYTTEWSKWYGYYKETPAYASLIDKKALWTIGRGFKANETTTKILNNIKGFGKDSFNTIMANGVRVYTLGGDFLAEKVMTKRKKLINLKPLNPGQWKIVANNKGILQYYEQISTETPEGLSHNQKPLRLQLDQMFHLAWNRTADDIHGTGATEKLKETLDAFNEVINDQRIVFHRYVKPLLIFGIDTDDETEIATFKAKVETSVTNGENMIIPKDVVDSIQNISVPKYGTLDPLPWSKSLEKNFIKMEGIPSIINGIQSESSEAEAKIIYLAWQQVVEWNQLFLEEQIKSQLGLEVKFNFPASIAPELINDTKKKGTKDNTASINTAGKQE
ncbi:MAG: hypothetical protein U9N86_10390 [Bacteroidota bacterium]|nr:hypothetical protein [Bacteroidota bacterium]